MMKSYFRRLYLFCLQFKISSEIDIKSNNLIIRITISFTILDFFFGFKICKINFRSVIL